MGEAVDLLNNNTNCQAAATVELIIGQNTMIVALQQRVGFLEDQLNQMEVRLAHVGPPTPEVIDLTSDEDDDVEVVNQEVRENEHIHV